MNSNRVERLCITNHFFDQLEKRFEIKTMLDASEFIKNALRNVLVVKHQGRDFALVQESFGTCIKATFGKEKGRFVLLTVFESENFTRFKLRPDQFRKQAVLIDLSKKPIYWGEVVLQEEKEKPVIEKSKKKKEKEMDWKRRSLGKVFKKKQKGTGTT